MEDIIVVKNLVKYYKEVKAVDNISFSVKQGSLFAFLGENGAGKSTTINVLCTVLQKTSGKVIIDGNDLDKDANKIRNLIGIVFQNSVLDDVLTIKENLLTRASYYGMTKQDALKRIELLDTRLGLRDILNRKYSKLSGGQRRRADIARALIRDPKILFLDEPTTGLDPKTRMVVWQTINDLRKQEGLTVFLTTHYMEETLWADEVVIIDHGHITASGTPASLKSTYTSNRLYWYIQRSKEYDKLIKDNGFNFEYHVDAYQIPFTNYDDITRLIYNNKSLITNYEVIKGNMDDVFLAVTGRKLGE